MQKASSLDRINMTEIRLEYDFFFRGTFHNMFQTQHTCTYSCIGTSGKKLSKIPMRGFWQKTTAKGKEKGKTLIPNFVHSSCFLNTAKRNIFLNLKKIYFNHPVQSSEVECMFTNFGHIHSVILILSSEYSSICSNMKSIIFKCLICAKPWTPSVQDNFPVSRPVSEPAQL